MILLLDITQVNRKLCPHENLHMEITASFFIGAKTQKQQRFIKNKLRYPTLCNPMDCSLHVPLSMGLSRQESWSGLPFPTPRDLPNSWIEPLSLLSPALAGGFFTTIVTWEDLYQENGILFNTKMK